MSYKISNFLKLLMIVFVSIIPMCKKENIHDMDTSIFTLNTNLATEHMNNIVVFIKFKNSTTNHLVEEQSIKNAEIIFNSETSFEMDSVNGKILVPSIKKYFEKQSYGKFSLDTEFFNHKSSFYEDSHEIGYYLKYNENNPIGYQNEWEATKREMELLENVGSFIEEEMIYLNKNICEYDKNNDEKIDHVMLIVEGQKNLPSSISWGDLLWSHKSEKEVSTSILGKKLGPYNLLYATDYKEATGLFSMNRGTYGTIIHEFGHSLGYLDLYSYHSSTKPVGFYDVMGNVVGSNPQNFLTYFTSEFQSETAWHQPLTEITKTTKKLTLYKPKFIDDTENRAVKVVLNSMKDEYFVMEYYEKQNTYNSYTALDSGVIVYRVNENKKYEGNNIGSNHIYIFRPNEPFFEASQGDLTRATLNKKRRKLGMPLENQDWSWETITFSDGTNTGIVIEVVDENDESVTLNITIPELEGNGTKENPYKITNERDYIYFLKQNTKNQYYELEKNLDFKGITYPKILFEGNLNGKNHVIKNITSKENGLFFSVGNFYARTTIQNIALENIFVQSSTGDYIGGLANSAENVVIDNVHILSGTIKNEESSLNSLASTGGFIGTGTNMTIQNSTVELEIFAKKNVGGLIGLNNNVVLENCFGSSNVYGSEAIGSVIGLQNITDSEYHIPKNVYYVDRKQESVGGYTKYFHQLAVLKENELDKGLMKLFLHDLQLNQNEFLKCDAINPQFFTYSTLNPSIASWQDNKIKGIKRGTTTLYLDIKFGSMKKRFSMKIQVLSQEFLVSYQSQVQKQGWLDLVSNGETSGTVGSGLRMETLKVNLENQEVSGNIEYRTHIQKKGWETAWKKNGEISGSVGEGLRLEAVQIRLTGEISKHYDIYYRIHSQKFGWLDWAKNGSSAGTAGYGLRVEAIQIKLVKKGSASPGKTTRPYVSYDNTSVTYQTHVQKNGWLNPVSNGVTNGTIGSGLRMETLRINLKNQGFNGNIEYRTHIQKQGWEKTWKKNGENSGTTGLGLRLEALQLRLTGCMAEEYDIYYRVHAQKFGWLGWAKNGESAGTAGFGYRLEAIQVMLVRKSMTAPGSTDNHYYIKIEM